MKTKRTNINFVSKLLQESFGVSTPIHTPFEVKDRYDLDATYNLEFVSDSEADRLSQFGTPVLGSFTIAGGKYLVYDRITGILGKKEYASFEFPVTSIVDFSCDKNIEKTPIIGTVGTHKTTTAINDWKITIKGFCLNDPSRRGQQTAREQQMALIALNEIAGAIEIEKGALFLDKEITRFVIESVRFPALQGKPNIIPFEIEAVSDEDFLIAK